MAETEKKNQNPVSDEVKASQTADKEKETGAKDDDYVIAERNWYILKVQVNREESIKKRLQENVNRMKLNNFVTDILVPKETISVVKKDRKSTRLNSSHTDSSRMPSSA